MAKRCDRTDWKSFFRIWKNLFKTWKIIADIAIICACAVRVSAKQVYRLNTELCKFYIGFDQQNWIPKIETEFVVFPNHTQRCVWRFIRCVACCVPLSIFVRNSYGACGSPLLSRCRCHCRRRYCRRCPSAPHSKTRRNCIDCQCHMLVEERTVLARVSVSVCQSGVRSSSLPNEFFFAVHFVIISTHWCGMKCWFSGERKTNFPLRIISGIVFLV